MLYKIRIKHFGSFCLKETFMFPYALYLGRRTPPTHLIFRGKSDGIYRSRKPMKMITPAFVGQIVRCLGVEIRYDNPPPEPELRPMVMLKNYPDNFIKDAIWFELDYANIEDLGPLVFYDGDREGNSPERRYDRFYHERHPDKNRTTRRFIENMIKPWGLAITEGDGK